MPDGDVIARLCLCCQRDADQFGAHLVGGSGFRIEGDDLRLFQFLHQIFQSYRCVLTITVRIDSFVAGSWLAAALGAAVSKRESCCPDLGILFP